MQSAAASCARSHVLPRAAADPAASLPSKSFAEPADRSHSGRENHPIVVRTHHVHSAAMDRRLARRNIRTALIVAVIGLLMFALTFVAALLYDGV